MYLQGLAHGVMLTAFGCALWLRCALIPQLEELERDVEVLRLPFRAAVEQGLEELDAFADLVSDDDEPTQSDA